MKHGWMGRGLLLAGLLMAALGFSGCEMMKALEDDSSSDQTDPAEYQPIYVLSFHQEIKYPRGLSKLERKAQAFDGREVWYNANQFLGSEYIEEIKAVEVPGKPERRKLILHLNRTGKLNWQLAYQESQTKPMIFLLDGKLMGAFNPGRPTSPDQEWYELDYEFDSVLADGIVKYSIKNYEFFNPSESSWFE